MRLTAADGLLVDVSLPAARAVRKPIVGQPRRPGLELGRKRQPRRVLVPNQIEAPEILIDDVERHVFGDEGTVAGRRQSQAGDGFRRATAALVAARRVRVAMWLVR